jgi:hypothetical protein
MIWFLYILYAHDKHTYVTQFAPYKNLSTPDCSWIWGKKLHAEKKNGKEWKTVVGPRTWKGRNDCKHPDRSLQSLLTLACWIGFGVYMIVIWSILFDALKKEFYWIALMLLYACGANMWEMNYVVMRWYSQILGYVDDSTVYISNVWLSIPSIIS